MCNAYSRVYPHFVFVIKHPKTLSILATYEAGLKSKAVKAIALLSDPGPALGFARNPLLEPATVGRELSILPSISVKEPYYFLLPAPYRERASTLSHFKGAERGWDHSSMSPRVGRISALFHEKESTAREPLVYS